MGNEEQQPKKKMKPVNHGEGHKPHSGEVKEPTASGAPKLKKKLKHTKTHKTKKNLTKNIILFTTAGLLFLYTFIISIFPAIVTNTFNLDEFLSKTSQATNLVTDADSFDFSVSPNLHSTMKLHGLKTYWAGSVKQNLFFANYIEIETNNPFAIVTGNYNINHVKIKKAEYTDQVLQNGKNKLANWPQGFDTAPYGKKSITIIPGKTEFQKYKINYIGPDSFREQTYDTKTYTRNEVKDFLKSCNFVKVNIK